MSLFSAADKATITGVILAGGRGSRMGGNDKGLLLYRNQPLYQHVLYRLRPQVDRVWINANRNIALYQQSGLPVIRDTLADFPGPLAGMLSALLQAETEWLAFSSCDTPHLPDNLVEHLWRHKGLAKAVWARAEQRDHPTLALLHRDLAGLLAQYLARGERKLLLFLQQAGGHSVEFSLTGRAFDNINQPEDLIDR
ncbi:MULTISPECIES: molybdenum cofactor guanylyltransferase MobA [unclassified Erwinia]|uniref:molybdenum cofactor guanylyltransferase MobA n=1 Tax=unclassified Erwinia TaxID=2622719 RepID=UPI0006FBD268|nr:MULTISPECIES: molybdenum cofactor guanylyltransferase MobA [unclassified Erwinia]KQN63232.1 molybdenum cofactor guanylyltransferase [Erwinia sp. Leaf53]PLV54709.1 molybdopterin-guanine dinucleotide biosynthesis protein MobA [Erwinia sp. B116]